MSELCRALTEAPCISFIFVFYLYIHLFSFPLVEDLKLSPEVYRTSGFWMLYSEFRVLYQQLRVLYQQL